MEPTATQTLQEIVLTAVIPILVAIFAWAVKKGMAYVDAKTKFLDGSSQEKAKESIKLEILNAITVSVQATMQCYVDSIKAARADGKLTDEEKKEARAQAKSRAVSILRNCGLSVGDALLDATIEATVGSKKLCSVSCRRPPEE